jgi:hypothetical protein
MEKLGSLATCETIERGKVIDNPVFTKSSEL